MTTEQVKCASSLFFSKPISVIEVVMYLLGEIIITKSNNLVTQFISTPPPERRRILEHGDGRTILSNDYA